MRGKWFLAVEILLMDPASWFPRLACAMGARAHVPGWRPRSIEKLCKKELFSDFDSLHSSCLLLLFLPLILLVEVSFIPYGSYIS